MKTLKGRVVYDRPKHSFTIKDVFRIISRRNVPFARVPSLWWEYFQENLSELLVDLGIRIEDPTGWLYAKALQAKTGAPAQEGLGEQPKIIVIIEDKV